MQKQVSVSTELKTQSPQNRPSPGAIPDLQQVTQASLPVLSGTEKQPSQSEGDPIATIILSHVDRQVDREARWSIAGTETWIIISPAAAPLPEQGWKLHVSAGLSSAEEVLHRVLPVLQAENVRFKVAATLKKLHALNHGFLGSSQIGKFITVYTCDEKQAVRLALALDEVTRGLRGPVVPSDRQLHPDSLISYRYGSYVSKLMYTEAGKVVATVVAPSGALIADTRALKPTVLDWVQDPFLAAGVVAPQEKIQTGLIHNRYVHLFTLSKSSRGGTFLGADILQGRTCVLKFALRNAYLALDGKDAHDILRYEAHILALLADADVFPTLFDLVEQDTVLYMVMEEIPGDTLGKYIERLFAAGDLPVSLILSWGKTLTRILGKIHAQGFVYRDLKPTNIMVTGEQRLRLIDFELVVEQGHKHAKSDIGTRGFMSPQHQSGQAACIADDIYSLGALLYYLVTKANPSFAPDPTHLLQRPLAVLHPTLDPGLALIITRCLEPDPEHRFSSMDALEDALTNMTNGGTTASSVVNDDSVSSSMLIPQATCAHYQQLAKRLGDTLCQTALHQPDQPGVLWLSMTQFPEGRALRAVNSGCSGTVLALTELVEVFEQVDKAKTSVYRATLEEGVQWLLHSDNLIANPVPGLYVGEAGVGAALLRAGQILGNQALVVAATKKGRWIEQQPYNCQDVMSGAAGRLRFHLLLWDETQEQEHLQAAIAAGNWLGTVAEDAGDGGLCWTLPPAFTGMTYLGYAHGAAGIADTLLDLFEVTHNERFLALALGAYRLLRRLAVPVLADQSGLNWPLYAFDTKREMAGVYWCHGATGIGKFLLHLDELKLVSETHDLITRTARTVAHGARWIGPTQCHGLAGNGEFLLDMFQWTGNQVYYTEALTLVGLLETFAVEQKGQLVWPSDDPSCISPDYSIGYAGVLNCLLRFAHPEHRPHLLSRRGFAPYQHSHTPSFDLSR